MITKNKITINAIINFVHEAIHHNMEVYIPSFRCYKYAFNIDTAKDSIKLFIDDKENKIIISSGDKGHISVDISISARDIIDLEALVLDIKEYNEEKALNCFNNFFNNLVEKPTNIDDLNDDED